MHVLKTVWQAWDAGQTRQAREASQAGPAVTQINIPSENVNFMRTFVCHFHKTLHPETFPPHQVMLLLQAFIRFHRCIYIYIHIRLQCISCIRILRHYDNM